LKPNLTLERLYTDYPEFYGYDLIERHVDRYKWAASYLKPTDTVLDIACGSGYGTKILAEKCKTVDGADNNADALHYACRKYDEDNMLFFEANLLDKSSIVGVDKYTFDDIVCIETIEHLKEKDVLNTIKIFHSILKPKGKLIMTTPDANQSEHKNIYHRKEYNKYELEGILMEYFRIIMLDTKDKSIYAVAEK